MLASLVFLIAHQTYLCLSAFALGLSPHCHMALFLPFFLSLIMCHLIRNTLSLHISLPQLLYSTHLAYCWFVAEWPSSPIGVEAPYNME